MSQNRHRASTTRTVVGLIVAATVLSVAGCTASGDAPGPQEGRPHASADQRAPRSDQHAERRRAGRSEGAIVLGDLNRPKTAAELGAPFDPCTTVTWADFPSEVRPNDGKPRPPQLRAVDKEDMFDIRCLYDNSGKVAVNTDGSSGGVSGGYFLASVVWTAGDRLDVDPSTRPGSEPKTWNNRQGLLQRQPDDPKAGRSCVGMVELSAGVGGVVVSNGRFPTDPCVIADGLMAAIADRAE